MKKEQILGLLGNNKLGIHSDMNTGEVALIIADNNATAMSFFLWLIKKENNPEFNIVFPFLLEYGIKGDDLETFSTLVDDKPVLAASILKALPGEVVYEAIVRKEITAPLQEVIIEFNNRPEFNPVVELLSIVESTKDNPTKALCALVALEKAEAENLSPEETVALVKAAIEMEDESFLSSH